MALDTQGGPNWTNNFVDSPIIINAGAGEYYRQPSYYALAHFSKFLPPGSVRVDTTSTGSKASVAAFRRPDNSVAVIVVNNDNTDIDLTLEDGKEGRVMGKVGPKTIQTYVYYD